MIFSIAGPEYFHLGKMGDNRKFWVVAHVTDSVTR